MKTKLLGMLLAGSIMAAAPAAHAASTGVWTGVDFAPDSYYIYLGGITALSNQDITSGDGWLARLDAGYGEYDYNTAAVAGGEVDADVTQVALLGGYRHFFQGGNITGYLGGDYQNHDQSPRDPGNKVEGSKGGVKAQAELALNPAQNVDVRVYGNYSTGFHSYWSHASVSYDFGSFALGPTVGALGNSEFHQWRAGATLSQIDIGFADVSFSAGYAASSGRGDDGAYGGFGFSKMF